MRRKVTLTDVAARAGVSSTMVSYVLRCGEFAQIRAALRPQPNSYFMRFTSADEEIVTVDAFGIMEGLKPGTTTILVEDELAQLGLKKTVTVTVQ